MCSLSWWYDIFFLLGLLASVPSNGNGNVNGGLMGYSPGENLPGCASVSGKLCLS